MVKMKTLTVSGQTYTVCDPEAVSFGEAQVLTPLQQQIARDNIGACTEKAIQDKLCPVFTQREGVVTCEPVEGSPLKVVSNIVPTQSGTGDPSFDNIRPINGHSAVKVTRCGKNFFGGDTMADAMVSFGATKNEANGTVNFTPSKLTNSSGWVFDKFKENTQYTVILYGKGSANSTNLRIRYTDNSYSLIPFVDGGYARLVTNVSKQVSAFAFITSAGDTTLYYDQCGIFEGDVSIAEFEAYKGNTFTFDLGQTVYGGSLDWATGLLTIGWGKWRMDSNANWVDLSGDTDEIYPIGLNCEAYNIPLKNTALCTHFARGTKDGTVGQFWINPAVTYSGRFMVPTTITTTLAGWRTYLAENEVALCYELAEPITVQLSAQEILALGGVNTLHSDTGDTEVTGKADLTAIINKLTNAILSLGGNI